MTACFSTVPITVQAGLRVRKLALHSNRSYGYAFRSRAALTNTNPAPAPVILVRNAGQSKCGLTFFGSTWHLRFLGFRAGDAEPLVGFPIDSHRSKLSAP